MTTAVLKLVAVWQREKVGVELFFNEHPEWAQIGEKKDQKRERTKKHTRAPKSFWQAKSLRNKFEFKNAFEKLHTHFCTEQQWWNANNI